METMVVFWIVFLCYFACISRYAWAWQKALRTATASSPEPLKVTVVIAAKEEEKNIENVLADLHAQTRHKDTFEVVLVDDHSEDKTYDIAVKWQQAHPAIHLRILQATEGQQGKKAALKQAIETANGDIILTTDADCRLPSTWIDTFSANFAQQEVHLCSAIVVYNEGERLFDRMQSLEFLSLVATGIASLVLRRPIMCNGANLAFRKKSFLSVGGYVGNENISSGDDIFLLQKMRKAFGKDAVSVCVSAAATVQTAPVETIPKLLSQRLRWAGKTPQTKNKTIYAVSTLIFLMNIALLIPLFGIFFSKIWLPYLMAGWVIKVITDFPILHSACRQTDKLHLLRYYIPLQLIYPFYITAIATAGLFIRPRWKNRKI